MARIQTVLLTVLLVNLAAAITKDDNLSPRQGTTWNTPNTQPTNPTQGADYDPHDFVPEQYNTIRIIHAVLMSIVWLILFPAGAVIIRAMNDPFLVWIHASIQMFAFWIFIAAAGMGIWMAKEIDQLHNYHPTIGLIMLALLSIQPATEILNHTFYHRHPKVIVVAHIHLWLGRTLLAVGVIQGGLGFLFAASFPKAAVDIRPRMAYGVMATVAYVMYLVVGVIWPEIRGSRKMKRRDEGVEMDVGRMERLGVGGGNGDGNDVGHSYYQVGNGTSRV